MEEALPFASREYFVFLAALFFARGMDFLSTWVATPNLVLEGNPIAKTLGWKLGVCINLALCVTFAFYPLTATIIATTSMLVAARNFEHAWIMRTLGEEGYRDWFIARMREANRGVYVLCLFAQTGLYGLIGAALLYFTDDGIPFAVGLGVIAYGITVLFYTLLSMWRLRRRIG